MQLQCGYQVVRVPRGPVKADMLAWHPAAYQIILHVPSGMGGHSVLRAALHDTVNHPAVQTSICALHLAHYHMQR